MAVETDSTALSAKPALNIFEKSSVLDWERIVRSWLLVALIILGVGGSIWGFYQETIKERARVTQAFETRSLQQANAIQSYLESTVSSMKSVVIDTGQLLGDNSLERNEKFLQIGIKNLLNNQYLVRASAWMPRDEGGHFQVRSLFYSPFYSAQASRSEFNEEMTLNPLLKAAIDKVIEEGRVVLFGLGLEKNVAALVPVYGSSQQATRQQRAQNLKGFLVPVLDIPAVIEVGLQRSNLYDPVTGQTLLDISDNSAPIALYRHKVNIQNQFTAKLLDYDAHIRTSGISWLLRFTAPYSQYGKQIPASAWVILTLGLLITAMLAAFAASLTHSARIEKIVHQRTDELKDAHEKVRASELMLIQAEKLSSIGGMVAGVAHEINTPLGFIRCNLEVMEEQLGELKAACQEQSIGELLNQENNNEQVEVSENPLVQFYQYGRMEDLTSMVTESLEGIGRISEIVVSLKDFSRMDRLSFDEVDLHHCINSTLNIAYNNIKHHATVIKDYGELPLVSCASGQINQVLLNILNNAAQAIEGFGQIVIQTRALNDKVSISIQDNGKGMPEQVRQKIFEPFFTTKDVGQGTGLGLSISDKIIRQHNGEILVDSTEGVGTTFTIILPVQQPLLKAA